MTREGIHQALMAKVDHNDDTGLSQLIEAIREGMVVVGTAKGGITLTPLANEPRHLFARRLVDLQRQSGITQSALASPLGISKASVLRYLNGHTLPAWLTACAMIEQMGGDPRDFMASWDAARATDRRVRGRIWDKPDQDVSPGEGVSPS